MLDTKRLLDQFLGGGSALPQGGGRSGEFDLGQLGDLARRTLGGGLGGGGLGGSGGGLGGGALAGGLAGILLGSKRGRKLGGSALRVGGMALIGALAYRAYQDWQAGQRPGTSATGGVEALPPPPSGTPFNPAAEADQQKLGRRLLRAMIAAAKADGHIDATEQAGIFAKMDALDLDADDKAFVMDELRAPLDVDAVAGGAATPEEAAEIYTASLLAIDVDNAAERGYLAMLAARLKLDDALVGHLHATVEASTEKTA
ncbi:tellurite resistance TerB family protein [Faunimonas sp. B44]|uniref:tellurite resistance TerB family protein n=1 Tax=Faunimonas sp. B44 TaxID=3461493 RepID=UPI0040446FED